MGEKDSFGARVAAAVSATGPLCAGIDPSSSLVEEWGLPDTPGGLLEFGIRCVDAFAGVVPVVKPQVAFFERMGAAGMGALETVIRRGREAGLLVIADAKRGDIGSTSAAYASAWLDPASPLASDAMTAVAYMGLGAIEPMVEMARAHGNGVIVVARSSNPEGRTVQSAVDSGGRSVADALLADIADRNDSAPGVIGAVIGATVDPSPFSLPGLGGPILAPGVGAQGGTAAEVATLFRGCPPGSVLPGVSRSLLAAGPDVHALRTAAADIRDELAAALSG
ncbi:MAG: orotidine-5'-phosphate decarboxylase [Acidimicrobiales bacterium]